MVAIRRSSHAYFFDGVSDSVIIPQGRFNNVGQELPQGPYSPISILGESPHGTKDFTKITSKNDSEFALEAWVVPDCGGVIASCKDQFKLELGTVDTAGPATFTIYVESETGRQTIKLTTATDESTRYSGTVYPTFDGGIHDSYNRFITASNDATNLNINHRPLMHIVAGITNDDVVLYVNGTLVAKSKMPKNGRITRTNNHLFIGGKGGEFRGVIECIHFTNFFTTDLANTWLPLNNRQTRSLYRFEEPIEIDETNYTIIGLGSDTSSVYSAATDGTTTTIKISTTEAEAMILKMTGKAHTTFTSSTVDFTASPYSMGKYEVVNYVSSPGSASTMSVPHVPYNLLINPGAINRNTHKPNQKPPERVRLHSINASTGALTVSSIHVDFNNMATAAFGSIGLRGVLHDRTADVDDYFVVLGADLLVDNGTGKPYQPSHIGSQVIDTTGQMVLDESTFEQHGMIYSSQMATTSNSPNNPFAVSWPATLDELYQVGHSGRHFYSHVIGHEYLRRLPDATSEIFDQTSDGTSDISTLIYDSTHQDLKNSLPINSRLDLFNKQGLMEVLNIRNSCYVDTFVDNGLPASKKEMIAIGKNGFDIMPFLLKGPKPDLGEINTETRSFHLRPETVSRVALLKVPTLQSTHNLAPYVEIHYNAIDLSGASMGKSFPMLMVEKTVPAGNYVLTGTTTVLDVISADLADATKDTTLFAPGGYVELSFPDISSLKLEEGASLFIGDYTGGLDSDVELDETTCPPNYTPPNDVTAKPNTTPQIIAASHTDLPHESVYNKMAIEQMINQNTLSTASDGTQRISVSSTSSGTGVFDIGATTGNSNLFELFDIIDFEVKGVEVKGVIQPSNKSRTNQLAKMRSSISNSAEPNFTSCYYMMGQHRIRSVMQEEGDDGLVTAVTTRSIAESIVSQSVSAIGEGSPDSTIVKEIEPNAPVVTVSLGGPGQGAMNTKPTWDPSPFARLPWSTQHGCAAQGVSVKNTPFGVVTGVTLANGGAGYSSAGSGRACNVINVGGSGVGLTGTLTTSSGAVTAFAITAGGYNWAVDDKYKVDDTGVTESTNATFTVSQIDSGATEKGTWLSVAPLNNESPDMKSWGTYCFPKQGRIYLADGASAEYYAKTGSAFLFDSTDGQKDRKFMCQDGTTVNDRMFQSMNDVTHDYQLGTQYASTRALVEIPIFPNQFFQDTANGVYPGPDNSMKVHLDATYTAHTWNPTPVGRRCKDTEADDKVAFSSFNQNFINKDFIVSTTITQITMNATTDNHKIYVAQPSLFPESSNDKEVKYQKLPRYRRAFLASGAWCLYTNNPGSDGYLDVFYYSDNFFQEATTSASIFTSASYDSESLIPIGSDFDTPTADFEGRGDYYLDRANVQTQGGNLDYGLRQYVSAVEFSDGPKSNPHAPQIKSKRARGLVKKIEPLSNHNGYTGLAIVTVDNDAAELFPEVEYSTTVSANSSGSVLTTSSLVAGLGYTAGTGRTTTGGHGTGCVVQITSVGGTGNITGISVTTAGSGYRVGDILTIIESGNSSGGQFTVATIQEKTMVLSAGDALFTAQVTYENTDYEMYYLGVTPMTNAENLGNSSFLVMTEKISGSTPYAIPSFVTNMEGLEILLKKKGMAVKSVTNPSLQRDDEMTTATFRPIKHGTYTGANYDEWQYQIAASADSTTTLYVTQADTQNGARLLHANQQGLAIRADDEIYVEDDSTGVVGYVGKVASVTSYLIPTAPMSLTQNSGGTISAGATSAFSVSADPTSHYIDGDVLYAVISGVPRLAGIVTASTSTPNITIGGGTIIDIPDGTTLMRGRTTITLDANNVTAIAADDFIRVGTGTVMQEDDDALLNSTWYYPFAPGGLRNGDTVWMNMTMNNPHAVEGLFCKSRGVLNEGQVWSGFNGGEGTLAVSRPRESIPLENFLIGNNCLDTAINFAQHVNKTIELNYEAMGLDASQAPTIAYVDPYLASSETARVLLYDVAHDREFIAFHDIHMQVQSSAQASYVGVPRLFSTTDGSFDMPFSMSTINGGNPSQYSTQIDVANGYPTENKWHRATQQSVFIEGAYAHDIANNQFDAKNPDGSTGWVTDHFTNASPFSRPKQLNLSGQAVMGPRVNLAAGYPKGHTSTIVCDIIDPLEYFNVGDLVYAGAGNSYPTFGGSASAPNYGNLVGEVTAVASTGTGAGTITIGGGTLVSLSNNDALYKDVNMNYYGKSHGHVVYSGLRYEAYTNDRAVADSAQPRTTPATCNSYWANDFHIDSRKEKNTLYPLIQAFRDSRIARGADYKIRESSTLFDTPDGTRCISAFLALKGIRSKELDLSNHEENRLQHLPHWTQMDFVRRLTIDFGEVGQTVDDPDILKAAREVVRLINQAGAKKGRTHARRPSHKYPGESKRFDLSRVGPRQDSKDEKKDPTAAHISADFAATGSTYDPAPWWDIDNAQENSDRGTHMGYLRAHLGRIVEDRLGRTGYTIVIHSTVPGASGRNFCVWLDNSKGQSSYQPQFLIGHGGRFRNFWCQPDEILGENMHPAPMPLNKHGRPFAPVTTLREYLNTESTAEPFLSNLDFADRSDPHKEGKAESTAHLRLLSSTLGSGMTSNTVNDESFEIQSPAASFVEGLRPASRATARVNFGGLVESGIPGFAPDTGQWGFGRKGDLRFAGYYGKRFLYGKELQIEKYTGHVPSSQVTNESIGETPIYGFRLVDHFGRGHGVRYIYRKFGEKFSNEQTILPSTIENEICIFINDQDVSQGGFTLGQHMYGAGDATGRMSQYVETLSGSPHAEAKYQHWRGNKWRGVPAPNLAVHCEIKYDSTNKTLTLVLENPYQNARAVNNINSTDILGYLGFPIEDGLIQISDVLNDSSSALYGDRGHTYSYTHRTRLSQTTNDSHIFYGVEGASFTPTQVIDADYGKIETQGIATDGTEDFGVSTIEIKALVSPVLNHTTLMTDELMTAVTEFAINLEDPTQIEGAIFDCTNMYAFDGRTFGEWGIAPDAIRVRAFNPTDEFVPISQMFSASVHRDLGIQATHNEFGEYGKIQTPFDVSVSGHSGNDTGRWLVDTSNALTNTDIDKQTRFDCGYLPKTILQIRTKGKGHNANTPTPILVDSFNDPIDTERWRKNLKGVRFTETPGDHILPKIENPLVVLSHVNIPSTNSPLDTTNYRVSLDTDYGSGTSHPHYADYDDQTLGHFVKPCTGLGAFLRDDNGGGSERYLAIEPSFGERKIVYLGGNLLASALVEANNTPVNSSIEESTATQVEINGTEAVGQTTITVKTVDARKQFDSFEYMFDSNGQPYGFITAVSSSTNIFLTSPGMNIQGNDGDDLYRVPMRTQLKWLPESASDEWNTLASSTLHQNQRTLSYFTDERARLFDGYRLHGSAFSEPIVYFRGARDSVDHSVPLYFGGGFSGVVMDVNDGTQNDYSEFYTHPYSKGPTGCAGIQHANEISTSFANIDCNALMAFFPGTALTDNHRGSRGKPFYNQDNVLSPDMTVTGATVIASHPYPAKYTAGMLIQKPSPLVLRFAHPTARYEDHVTGTENKTTYIVFGPGQPFPSMEDNANNTNEPDTAYALVQGNTWSTLGISNLPNSINNNDSQEGPFDATYQSNYGFFHWRTRMNWEPAKGVPLIGTAHGTAGLNQRPEDGRFFGDSFTNATANAVNANTAQYYMNAHPTRHCVYSWYGSTRAADYVWHMEGGYAPGGSWLDNQITCNPPHALSNYRVAKYSWSHTHPSSFRVSAAMATSILPNTGPANAAAVDMEYIVVDATRCQNGEELATVLGNAINEHPGGGALKAMGGTFMPSMGNAMRQDRTGWVSLTTDTLSYSHHTLVASSISSILTASGDVHISAPVTNQATGEQLPACGWLRTQEGGRNPIDPTDLSFPTFAPYHSREVYESGGNWFVRFYLAPNRISGFPLFEDAYTFDDHCRSRTLSYPALGANPGDAVLLGVWTKTGIHRVNNVNHSARDHMAQVHFNGLMDAIDRTRPIGAMGWAGERYSYLNTLPITDGTTVSVTSTGVAIDQSSAPTGYVSGTTAAMDTDSSISSHFAIGDTVFNSSGKSLGLVTAVTSTSIRIEAGTKYKLEDNELLYKAIQIHNGAGYGVNTTGAMNTNFAVGTLFSVGEVIYKADGSKIGTITAIGTSPDSITVGGGTLVALADNDVIYKANRVYAAGKGAWHPKLGFSSYGAASSCLNVLSHLPSAYPMLNSPEASPISNGTDSSYSLGFGSSLIHAPYHWNVFKGHSMYTASGSPTAEQIFRQARSQVYNYESYAIGNQHNTYIPEHYDIANFELPSTMYHPQGLYGRAMLVVSYESELPLVAKRDRDGITSTGDWLAVVSKTQAGVAAATAITFAGTTQWDERIHDPSRFTAPATAGPNVEALIATGTSLPTVADLNDADASPFNATYALHSAVTADTALFNAEPCLNHIGDLFFDYDKSPGSGHLETYSSRTGSVERNLALGWEQRSSGAGLGDRFGATDDNNAYWIGDVNGYDTYKNNPAKNFSVEHVVWKRMDGGNLSLPASNARGLGAVPWITRVLSNTPHVMGEELLGNCRFSFETTNSAMFPVIQAQELSHPQLAARHPDELRNVLMIPNEDIQFDEIEVQDDTGQIHLIEGGSPFGTIIRGFRTISDRGTEGLAPAIANSGVSPNLKVQLPNPDSVPGNIIVRSGFDPIQAYQTETIGGGGMLHPSMDVSVKHLFNNSVLSPRLGPTFDNLNWEHISQESSGVAFPDVKHSGWENATDNKPLQTSYELHDRTLFFHVTKTGNTHTHRYPTTYTHSAGVVNNDLTATTYSGTTLTVNASINTTLFATGFGESEVKDSRRFLRLYNPTTGRGGVASYTSISGSEFRGCVGDSDFDALVTGSVSSLKVVPSYYTPAGSSRFYAARRLRDHSEVSGSSPDMAHTQYFDGVADFTVGSASYNNDPTITHASSTAIRVNMLVSGSGIPTGAYVASVTDATHFELSASTTGGSKTGQTLTFQTPAYEIYKKPKMTPMPIPRMGHHYVTPTMAMLPGHWAHPAYQAVYDLHRACRSSTTPLLEKQLMDAQGKTTLKASVASSVTDQFSGHDPPMNFSSLTATPSGPSDIHGGAFTLMFESKVRHDGYGILASKGQAGVINSKGGHTIVLEAAANYTLDNHFPDPSEVGAYQIVIQPNLHTSQLTGFHENGGATALPDGSVEELTNQQVALVIGMKQADSTRGAVALVLAEATMADVRGCEVFINELMIDLDPDYGSQFTNIPPLLTYNALGVQGTESPAFTRANSLPYHPGMFANSTPGFTTNIPWWSILHNDPTATAAVGFRHLSVYRFDDYYEFCRANFGSISSQLTLAGYPSIHPDIYSPILENTSLNPSAIVKEIDTNGKASWAIDSTYTGIRVDDARAFMEEPYFGQVLEYTDNNGVRRTKSYTFRSGVQDGVKNTPSAFSIELVSAMDKDDPFYANLEAGMTIRLSRAYDFKPAGSIFTDADTSIITRTLPQTLQGTRDTNSLHMADAFLSLWHPNLGRPHTYYSDSSRTWATPASDRAVDAKPYNMMPEHFETIHYHDATYYASMGPFGFHVQTPIPSYHVEGDALVSGVTTAGHLHTITHNTLGTAIPVGTYVTIGGKAIGTVYASTTGQIQIAQQNIPSIKVGDGIYIQGDGSLGEANAIDGITGLSHQGGQFDGSDAQTKTMLNKFWPCGSRGGPLVSRLDGYAYVSTAWTHPRQYDFDAPVWSDQDDDGSYAVSSGITKANYSSTHGGSGSTRPRPFGYRYGLRQPYNRPQWSLHGGRGFIEANESASSGTTFLRGYKHGPLVQEETQTWTYTGGSGLANATYPSTYVGIMERKTNFSGMLAGDKAEWQVRYSEGRRMTRPFGCPVRTLRNTNNVARDWWGEGEGKNLSTIDQIAGYYIVDWWGNTRGEDVRRYPVRGFGIRPAWDCGNAYEYDRTNGRTPFERILNDEKPIFNMKNVVAWNGTTVSVSSNYTLPRFGGTMNDDNNNNTDKLVDVFAPTHSMRIGDMGNGRGVRYPTMFNEDVLTALDEPTHTTGLVLSHNTAEPPVSDGLIRPRNDTLQTDEIIRGISNKLDIAEDGLLKPEAVVSDRVETISGSSPHKDPISRSSPRIGIDAENDQNSEANLVVINTEAHSLHTDRNVGQRIVLEGGLQSGSQTLAHYDLTALTFAGQPQGGVMRFSHTNPFTVLGGTYILEARNYLKHIDDTGWTAIPTSGMALWLKADNLTLANGAAVTQWNDLSGNSRNFTQSSSSLQPSYVASDSDFNNMPVINFDGSDKLAYDFDAGLNTNEFTIFIVTAVSSDTDAIESIIDSRSASPVTRSGFNFYADMRNSGGANNWEFWVGKNTGWQAISSGTDTVSVSGAPSLLVGQISGGDGAGATATQLFRVNGTQIGTASPGFYKSTADASQLGTNATSSYQLNGDMAEIIQYNRALSTEEIKQVEAYLATKYSISGTAGFKTSNPYETAAFPAVLSQTNYGDKSVKFLVRPVRMLDKQHVEIFRPNNSLHSSSPQYGSTAYGATAGGKYGVFAYEMPNARASSVYMRGTNPDTNPPYAPVYRIVPGVSDSVPVGKGPKLLGSGMADFDKTTIGTTVSRLVISENTLQHHRSDAARRRTVVDDDGVETRADYNVQPRFSQSLHPKGHKGDVSFNSSDHSGDAA
jgi:hypothetical protein